MTHRASPTQPLLGFAEVGPDNEIWEYAALVTSLDNEILTLGQLYRDRADAENVFDELKNQLGLGRLYDPGPVALPVARRHRGSGLQLVEPVRSPGRSCLAAALSVSRGAVPPDLEAEQPLPAQQEHAPAAREQAVDRRIA